MSEESIDRLCSNILQGSINWYNVWELRDLAKTNALAREKYEAVLRALVSLGRLSFESKDHYSIDICRADGGGSCNPQLDGKKLYYVKQEDAEKLSGGLAFVLAHHLD